MNKFSQRPSSNIDFNQQNLTERCENQSFTSRNHSSNDFFDFTKHKNHSQILTKEQNKSNNQKPYNNRKKTVSSYYFLNNKKSKQNIKEMFANRHLNNPNPNYLQRKRCQTTFDFTTNKTANQNDRNQKKCIIVLSPQNFSQNKQTNFYCINHPQKLAYFEEQGSLKCYCHECSIQNAKKNKRLIEMTPQIKQIKKLVMKRVSQTHFYGEQICAFIKNTIKRNIQQLNSVYQNLKLNFSQKRKKESNQNQKIYKFQLEQIDWGFFQNSLKGNQVLLRQKLNFLIPKQKIYQIIQKNQQKKTQKLVTSFDKVGKIYQNSKSYKCPYQLEKQVLLQNQNQLRIQSERFSSKDLTKQIENALNYQSRDNKIKIKKVNLKVKSEKSKLQQNRNKQNIEPNILENQINIFKEK